MKHLTTMVAALAALLVGSPQASAQLGSDDDSLVYTPVEPCRVFDTREISPASPLAPNVAESFLVYGAPGPIAAQGGNPLGCLAPDGEPVAVHINLTVPVGENNGFVKAFPKDGVEPNASILNYRSNVPIANSATIRTKFDIADQDISVLSNRTTHILGDVQGYYYPAEVNVDFEGASIEGTIYSNVIDSTTAENTITELSLIPSLTVDAGSFVYLNAVVALNPQSNGNLEINLFPCVVDPSDALVILQSYNNIANEHQACYTGQNTSDYILAPVQGVIPFSNAGTYRISICGNLDTGTSCVSPVDVRTYLQSITVFELE